jgi:hypothetical protein
MPEKDEALAMLAQRYYTGHGPATVEDLMWWAGLNKTEATAAVESVRHQLLHETVNGATYWFAEAAAPKIKPGTAYLLPTYDEYEIAYKDRSAVIDPAVKGTFTSSIIFNGRAVGVWNRALKKDKVMIQVNPHTSFTAAQHKAISTAAKHYGKFIGFKPIIETS